eukprot:403374237
MKTFIAKSLILCSALSVISTHAQTQQIGNTNQDKCYGLVLSDAIDLGPHQAGVMSHYIQMMAQKNLTYNTVSGVGVGALNAYLYSLYQQGEETKLIQDLQSFWHNISSQSHYSIRGDGFIYGLFFEDSLYESSNLNQILQKNLKNQTKAKGLSIGITNVLNGMFKVFDEETSYSDMMKVIQASITYVGIGPMVDAFQALWFTGSTIYELDINSAIIKCKNLGYSENNTVIDVILSAYPMLSHEAANLNNGFKNIGRTIQLQAQYEKLFGVIRTKLAHPLVNIRYISGPTEEVASKNFPFDYSKGEVDYLFTQGVQDAQWAIKNSEIISESLSPIFYNDYQSKSEKKTRRSGNNNLFLQQNVETL